MADDAVMKHWLRRATEARRANRPLYVSPDEHRELVSIFQAMRDGAPALKREYPDGTRLPYLFGTPVEVFY